MSDRRGRGLLDQLLLEAPGIESIADGELTGNRASVGEETVGAGIAGAFDP
jgi:hypothetical protein